jgi:hypothetical protein
MNPRDERSPRIAVDAPVIGEQTIVLALDDRIALAHLRFQPRAVEHDNAATALMNQSRFLQLSGSLRDAFAAHAQHIGNQTLR